MSKILHVKTWSMLLLASLLSTGTAYATSAAAAPAAPQAAQQAGTCNGVVLDEFGDPLMGATVRVVGTAKAVATNLDGEFSLNGVKPGEEIQVSYIGYEPKFVKWNGQALTIKMEETSTTLDEVVVMGYGVEQKRAKVTNSIAKVSEQTLTVGANANPAQALAGAVSGVKVNVTSGDPSATPSIVVRGGTNFDGSGAPVVVVDGQIRSSLSDINPNDIGSMEVLKDAGATALYGARAANGVILITTKSGKKGTSQLNLNVKYGISSYSDIGYDFVNAREYLEWYRPAISNTSWWKANNMFGSGQPYSTGATTVTPTLEWNILNLTEDNRYLLDHGWETMVDPIDSSRTILFKETDPLKYNLNDPASTQDYNLSFSGGNDYGNYYASLGYYDAEGAFTTTFYKRYNFAMTGMYKIAPWLQANSTFNYIRANWNNSPATVSTGNFFGRVVSMPHTIRLYNEEGEEFYGNNGVNLKYQPDKFIRDNQSDKFSMTQALTATIIEGLKVKASMSWYYNEEFDEAFNRDYQTNPNGNMNTSRSTSASFSRAFNQTYNVVANFNRTFAEKHTVNAMLGMEFYKGQYRGFSASGSGAPTDYFADLGLTFGGQQNPYKASTRSIDSYHQEEAILSYMGRVEYDYMDRYLVAATFREDGYSRLVDNRWGFFPGVSAGWVFTQENFWKENQALSFLNYGKLRTSFGMNGIVNSSTIGYYTLQGSYSSYKYNGSYGYRISGLPNPGLKWERTRTFEVGLDLGFFQNRANLGLTYYNRLTMDKYANLSLPQTTGFSSVVQNNGKYRNQGFEIDLSGTIYQNRDLRWTLSANLTYNKNVITELPDNGLLRNRQGGVEVYTGNGDETEWIGGYQEGQEPNMLIGYKKSHILRSQADVEAMGDYIDLTSYNGNGPKLYANQSGLDRLRAMGLASGAIKLEPGDVVWSDRNGDNMIEFKDRYILGNRLAHWTGGFNTTINWKGLQLYARFDMGFDFTVFDNNLGWWLGCAQGSYSFPTQIRDTWTADNPNAKYPRYTWAAQLGTDNWIRTSDVLSSSGAYLACRELQLSYTLPLNIASKFASKGLTVSVTGQNLGYFKKCTQPLPDYTPYTDANTGGNGGTYNLPRTVLFGLNVTF